MPSPRSWASTVAIFTSLLSTVRGENKDLLEGYGYRAYEPECASACRYSIPTALDCPEYAGLTPEQKLAAYPSPLCFAKNTPFLTSAALCIQSRCNETKPSKIQIFWETRLMEGQPNINSALAYSSYFEALQSINLTITPPPWSVNDTVLNKTISVTDEQYLGYHNALLSFEETEATESWGMMLIVLSGIFIPIGLTILSKLPWPTRMSSMFYGYFVDPPMFGKRHTAPWRNVGMVPTRGQAIFLLCIICINIVTNTLGYQQRTPNTWFPDRTYELTRYIANRAGGLSFANMPLIVLYSGRNNPLLWVTNWSHATYLLAHRWIATICVLQACLHSAMWLQIIVKQGSYFETVRQPYWYWGILGTLAMSLLIPFSILPLRQRWYEFFLFSHIVLAILVIVGSFYHIVLVYDHQSGFDLFIYATFAIWALERAIRLARIAKHGIKRAYITRVNEEYIRVDVPGVEGHGYCYAYFPTISWRVWENHPFSIMDSNFSRLGQSSASSGMSSPVDSEMIITPQDEELPAKFTTITSASYPKTLHGRHTNGITFFIRVHKGTTKKLAELAGSNNGIPILIEGSYGHEGITALQGGSTKFAPSLDYPNLLCIAGGAGIAAVFPALSSTQSIYGPKGTTKLYWGLRSKQLADSVETNLAGLTATDNNWGNIELHTTVGLRMNVRGILEDELKSSIGTTVVVCGPTGMCDEVRDVVTAMARHGKVVRLVQESLIW